MVLLLHILITAVAVWVTTALPGIELGGHNLAGKVGTLVVVAIVFGVVNAVLKPIAKTLGCVFYVITLGLFGLVVNGLLFWLTGYLAAKLQLPFEVHGFWPALWGALIVTIVSGVLHAVVRRLGGERDRADH